MKEWEWTTNEFGVSQSDYNVLKLNIKHAETLNCALRVGELLLLESLMWMCVMQTHTDWSSRLSHLPFAGSVSFSFPLL